MYRCKEIILICMGLVEDFGKSKEWDLGQVHGIGARRGVRCWHRGEKGKKGSLSCLGQWLGLRFLPSYLSIPRSGSQAIYLSQCGVCKLMSDAGLEVAIGTGDGVARL